MSGAVDKAKNFARSPKGRHRAPAPHELDQSVRDLVSGDKPSESRALAPHEADAESRAFYNSGRDATLGNRAEYTEGDEVREAEAAAKAEADAKAESERKAKEHEDWVTEQNRLGRERYRRGGAARLALADRSGVAPADTRYARRALLGG